MAAAQGNDKAAAKDPWKGNLAEIEACCFWGNFQLVWERNYRDYFKVEWLKSLFLFNSMQYSLF